LRQNVSGAHPYGVMSRSLPLLLFHHHQNLFQLAQVRRRSDFDIQK
jgi:hypothetical protein